MTDNTERLIRRTERYDTIVIGAGQAGLAAGYHLQRKDIDFLILESAPRIGDSWQRRWDSLRLFTPAAFSGLPGMPFPSARMHLPDKDEVASYLQRYAEQFDLPVRLNTRVVALSADGPRYVIETDGIRYEANNVIVATGPFQKPHVPSFAHELAPAIRQLHSSDYLNPFSLPDGPVLVAGAGNSGAQIALEVARFRRVILAGPSTGRIPRNALGRDIYTWLWPVLTRLTVNTRLGRMLRRRAARDPLIGITDKQLANAGIERRVRVTEARGGLPVVDGLPMDVGTVIWCTGFTPDYSWIRLRLALNNGHPVTGRGVAAGWPGLYFVGLRFMHSMTSALIGGVGNDADFVTEHILAARTD